MADITVTSIEDKNNFEEWKQKFNQFLSEMKNVNGEVLITSPVSLQFTHDEDNSTGLDFAVRGGYLRNETEIISVGDTTVTLADDSTSLVYLNNAPGSEAIESAVLGSEPNEEFIPLYEVTTATGAVTNIVDYRTYFIKARGSAAGLPIEEYQVLPSNTTVLSLTNIITSYGVAVYVDGQRLAGDGVDYSVTGSKEITFTSTIPSGSEVLVVMRDLEGDFQINPIQEIVTASTNGQTNFQLTVLTVSDALSIYVNGVRQHTYAINAGANEVVLSEGVDAGVEVLAVQNDVAGGRNGVPEQGVEGQVLTRLNDTGVTPNVDYGFADPYTENSIMNAGCLIATGDPNFLSHYSNNWTGTNTISVGYEEKLHVDNFKINTPLLNSGVFSQEPNTDSCTGVAARLAEYHPSAAGFLEIERQILPRESQRLNNKPCVFSFKFKGDGIVPDDGNYHIRVYRTDDNSVLFDQAFTYTDASEIEPVVRIADVGDVSGGMTLRLSFDLSPGTSTGYAVDETNETSSNIDQTNDVETHFISIGDVDVGLANDVFTVADTVTGPSITINGTSVSLTKENIDSTWGDQGFEDLGGNPIPNKFYDYTSVTDVMKEYITVYDRSRDGDSLVSYTGTYNGDTVYVRLHRNEIKISIDNATASNKINTYSFNVDKTEDITLDLYDYACYEGTIRFPFRCNQYYTERVALEEYYSIGRFMEAPYGKEEPGWVLADGRLLRKSRYPEYFGKIGYTYGGSGDYFAVPNMLGMHMRGYDPTHDATNNLGRNYYSGIKGTYDKGASILPVSTKFNGFYAWSPDTDLNVVVGFQEPYTIQTDDEDNNTFGIDPAFNRINENTDDMAGVKDFDSSLGQLGAIVPTRNAEHTHGAQNVLKDDDTRGGSTEHGGYGADSGDSVTDRNIKGTFAIDPAAYQSNLYMGGFFIGNRYTYYSPNSFFDSVFQSAAFPETGDYLESTFGVNQRTMVSAIEKHPQKDSPEATPSTRNVAIFVKVK